MEGEKDEPKGGIKEENPQQSAGEDVARRGKNPHIWRGGVSGEGKKRGRVEEEQKETPVKLLAAGVRLRKYLCVVGDIEAQADQAGLELLCAQSARVVLGGGRPVPGEAPGRGAAPQAMQQHIQRCQ